MRSALLRKLRRPVGREQMTGNDVGALRVGPGGCGLADLHAVGAPVVEVAPRGQRRGVGHEPLDGGEPAGLSLFCFKEK